MFNNSRSNIYFLLCIQCSLFIDYKRIVPSIHTTKENEYAEFFCDATHVIWTFNGRGLPDNVMTQGSTVQIYRVKAGNEGEYECLGWNRNDEVFYAKGVLKLICKFYYCKLCDNSLKTERTCNLCSSIDNMH